MCLASGLAKISMLTGSLTVLCSKLKGKPFFSQDVQVSELPVGSAGTGVQLV